MLSTMLYPSTVTQASISTSMPKLFMITRLEFPYNIIIMLVLYKCTPHMNIILQTTTLFECCIRMFTMQTCMHASQYILNALLDFIKHLTPFNVI